MRVGQASTDSSCFRTEIVVGLVDYPTNHVHVVQTAVYFVFV